MNQKILEEKKGTGRRDFQSNCQDRSRVREASKREGMNPLQSIGQIESGLNSHILYHPLRAVLCGSFYVKKKNAPTCGRSSALNLPTQPIFR